MKIGETVKYKCYINYEHWRLGYQDFFYGFGVLGDKRTCALFCPACNPNHSDNPVVRAIEVKS